MKRETQFHTNLSQSLIEVIISQESFLKLKEDNEQMIFVDYIFEDSRHVANKVVLKHGRLPYINEKMITIAHYNAGGEF